MRKCYFNSTKPSSAKPGYITSVDNRLSRNLRIRDALKEWIRGHVRSRGIDKFAVLSLNFRDRCSNEEAKKYLGWLLERINYLVLGSRFTKKKERLIVFPFFEGVEDLNLHCHLVIENPAPNTTRRTLKKALQKIWATRAAGGYVLHAFEAGYNGYFLDEHIGDSSIGYCVKLRSKRDYPMCFDEKNSNIQRRKIVQKDFRRSANDLFEFPTIVNINTNASSSLLVQQ